MRLYEFVIYEDISTNEAMLNIVDILTTQLPTLYRQLSAMAEAYLHNNGELGKGFKFVAGGQKSRWFNDVFFNNLKPSLYTLARSLPKNLSNELNGLLSDLIADKSMNVIQDNLPGILIKIGKSINNKKLVSSAESANTLVNNYKSYIDKLSHQDDDPAEIKKDKVKQPNNISSQNSEVEKIINDVLSRLDRGIAGDIRNVLAKKSNKLATLQQELSRRGLTPS